MKKALPKNMELKLYNKNTNKYILVNSNGGVNCDMFYGRRTNL